MATHATPLKAQGTLLSTGVVEGGRKAQLIRLILTDHAQYRLPTERERERARQRDRERGRETERERERGRERESETEGREREDERERERT